MLCTHACLHCRWRLNSSAFYKNNGSKICRSCSKKLTKGHKRRKEHAYFLKERRRAKEELEGRRFFTDLAQKRSRDMYEGLENPFGEYPILKIRSKFAFSDVYNRVLTCRNVWHNNTEVFTRQLNLYESRVDNVPNIITSSDDIHIVQRHLESSGEILILRDKRMPGFCNEPLIALECLCHVLRGYESLEHNPSLYTELMVIFFLFYFYLSLSLSLSLIIIIITQRQHGGNTFLRISDFKKQCIKECGLKVTHSFCVNVATRIRDYFPLKNHIIGTNYIRVSQ